MQDIEDVLSSENASFLEEQLRIYASNPSSLDENWRTFLEKISAYEDAANLLKADKFKSESEIHSTSLRIANSTTATDTVHALHQSLVYKYIDEYRRIAYRFADTNPLKYLRYSNNNIQEVTGILSNSIDPNLKYYSNNLIKETCKLKDIEERLEEVYQGKLGYEYTHISDASKRLWLQSRIESQINNPISKEDKTEILRQLINIAGFEDYLAKRYIGVKRFGVEGGEGSVLAVKRLLAKLSEADFEDVVIGMSHRGRLNVMVNAFGLIPNKLFDIFDGVNKDNTLESGDVKYHAGMESILDFNSKSLYATLIFNSSHLEFVNPIAMGVSRAIRDYRKDGKNCANILIHGDASFSGQGIVMESLNMMNTPGYSVGGTFHIVINNQVGFTTSKPEELRSSFSCSDNIKAFDCPVIHVNGDSPESILKAIDILFDYHEVFQEDVMLDIICYRRNGHNEQDNPSITQPKMYEFIKSHNNVAELYAAELIKDGLIDSKLASSFKMEYKNLLDDGSKPCVELFEFVRPNYIDKPSNKPYSFGEKLDISISELSKLGKKMLEPAEGIVLSKTHDKLFKDRASMYANDKNLDWGAAESLAYAYILSKGYNIRLSGEDCERGTFAHRHSVIYNQDSDSEAISYIPLDNIRAGGFEVINSVLSENAVLAYEYGYSTVAASTLVIWEAQFGDFANGAQVIIDSFMASSNSKWGINTGVMLLLPHGYEGQGPEHSSARVERFLELCANNNMEVLIPTTAAQIFNLFIRHIIRPQRIPSIVFSPKSLLRKAECSSSMKELAEAKFELILSKKDDSDDCLIDSLILCSGKVYFDLEDYRLKNNLINFRIIRIEQLYPMPVAELKAELLRYKKLKSVMWSQEENSNFGACNWIRHQLQDLIGDIKLKISTRPASSSTATGYPWMHNQQKDELIVASFK